MILIGLLSFVMFTKGQDPQIYFNLNTTATGTKSYVARDYVKLKPGFSYKPATANSFEAKIDPTITYPVIYQKPFASVEQGIDQGLDVGSIAGAFDVSPSGAATYSVPIDLPIGIDGMQPSLAVSYSSQAGNGLVGFGFNLAGLSAITRVPQDYYYNDYFRGITLTATDRFALDGNRLVTTGTYGASGTTYNTLIRNFSVITSWLNYGSGSPQYFTVATKDGKTLKYGSATGKLIVNNNTAIAAWYLDYVEDINGNYINYEYEQDGLNLYLKKIKYGLNKNSTDGILCTIELVYEKRTDEIPLVIGTQTDKMDRVLGRINTFINSELQNSYDFAYSKDTYTRLKSVTRKNSEGEQLNPTIFSYGGFKGGSGHDFGYQYITVSNEFGKSFENQVWFSGDRDGDGKDELISTYPYTNVNWLYTFLDIRTASPDESGGLSYTSHIDFLPENMIQTGSPYHSYWKNIGQNVMASGDFNSDGTCDVMYPELASNNIKFSCFQLLDGISYKQLDISHIYQKNINLEEPSEIPLFLNTDFNNDGNSDLLVLEKLSDDQNRNASITFLSQYDFDNPLESRNRFGYKFQTSTAPEEVFPFDYNNDGLKDLLIITSEAYYIYKNNGGANSYSFSSAASYSATNTLKGKMDCIRPGDFNGDGLADFIYNPNQTASWYFALNKGDGSFEIKSLPIAAYNDKDTDKDDGKDNCIIMDWNNDGLDDVITFDAFYNWEDDIWSEPWKEFRDFTVDWYSSTGATVSFVKRSISTDEADAYSNLFVQGDFNGDGRQDLISYGFDCWNGTATKAWRVYSNYNAGQNQGLLTGVADGFRGRTEVAYSNTILNENYTAETAPAGLIKLPASLKMVKTVNNYGGTSSTVNYAYQGATAHPLLGFLGFSKTTVTNTTVGSTATSNYSFKESASSYYMPYLKSSSSTMGGITNTSDVTYSGHTYTDKSCFIYTNTSTSVDNLVKKKVVTTTPYNSDGNPTSSKTETYETGGTKIAIQTATYSGYVDRFTGDGNSILNAPTTVVETFLLESGSAGSSLSSTTGFTYYTNGNIKTKKIFSGTAKQITSTFTYYPYSQRVNSVTEVGGTESRVTSYKYDATERFVSEVTNPLGHVMKYTSDLKGNQTDVYDPNNLHTQNSYNDWGVLTQTITPTASYTKAMGWAANGADAPSEALYYVETKRDNQFYGADYYDCIGRTVRKVSVGFNGARFYTDTKYNSKGQVESQTEPYAPGTTIKLTSYTYNTDGRVNRITLPDGRFIDNTYSVTASGSIHEETSTYSTGEVYTKKYNAAGLLVSATDPGGTISYDYFKNGKLKSTTAGGTTIGIRYDALGRQEYLDDPDAGTIQYGYNAWDNLTTQVQNGITTTMTYDKLNRMTHKTVGSEPVIDFHYDPANAIGMTDKIVKGSSGVFYTYDGKLNMTEEKCTEGSEILTFTYEYDPSNSRLNKMTYPNGFAVEYGYTGYDDLIEVKRADDGTSIWVLDEVNAKGQLTKATYGNSKQITYGYDTKDRLNRILVPTVIDFNYVFNDKNQLDNRVEKYYNGSTYSYFTERFTYDAVNRLSKVYHQTGTAAEVLKQTMGYDAGLNDRIVSKTGIGTFGYDETIDHRMDYLEAASTYNPTKQNYTYTATGKINTITDDAIHTNLNLTYNVLDQRFKQVISNSSTTQTRYYFNNYEKEVTGTTTRHLNYVYAGSGLVAIFTQEGTVTTPYYIYTDYLGSLRSITNASGTVVQTLSYDAWGNRRNPLTGVNYTTTPTGLLFARGYTGHEHVDMFGLINMNGRFYDPALGMFISPDNYVQAPDFSQNFNRYTYCYNNPLMYTDPTGYWTGWDDLVVGTVGFFYGYISYGIANDDWGWNAVGAGALSAGSFLLSYYSGGANSWNSAVNAALSSGMEGGGALAANAALNFSGRMIAGNLINSFLPAYTFPVSSNMSVTIGPAYTFGSTQSGLGLGVSMNYQYEGLNASIGVRFMKYGANYGGSSKETMKFWAVGYDDGTSGIFYSNTYYDSGGTSQELGAIGYRYKDFSFTYQNDYMFGLPADGGDRFRTAAAQVSWRDFSAGVNLFTGDPGLKDRQIDNINGHDTYITGLNGENPNKYRAGVGYVGYGNMKYGINSEKFRNNVQNKFAHDRLIYWITGDKSPYFQVLDITPSGYFSIGTSHPYTLW